MNRGWTYRDIQLMPFVDYYSLILWKIIAICIYGYVSALTGDFYLVKGTLGLMRLFPRSASCWNDLRRVIPRGHMAWLEPMYWLEHMAWLEPMCWLENLTAYVTGTIPAFDMDLSKENSHRNVISEGRRPLLAKTSMLKEGIYIINLRKPWEKLQMTTRVIVAIENPHDIIVQSARPYGQRDVLKFAQYTGADAIAGRHARGTFTNKMQTSFSEPRLLILTNPRTDHQPIKEYALGNISCIAFCDTDSPMRCVDISIPANNKGKQSIGCLYWLLARMVLQMRATILPGRKWENMVDLFFYRDPEEAKDLEEEEALVAPEYGAVAEYAAPTGDTWGAEWPGAVPPLLLLKDKLGLARLLQLLWLIGCGCSPCPYSHLTRQCAITYSELGVKE